MEALDRLASSARRLLEQTGYSRQSVSLARRFRQFLGRGLDVGPVAEAASPAVVVVRPWLATAIPWQFMTLALLLSRRNHNTIIVWDDVVLDPFFDLGPRVEHALIGRALKQLPLRVVRLSELGSARPLEMKDEELEKLVHLNAVKVFRGEGWSQELADYRDRTRAQLKSAAALVEEMMRRLKPSYVVVPGGIFGSSGLYPPIGRRAGVRVASLDHGPGTLMMCVDGIATHLWDIPRTVEMLGRLPPWAVESGRHEWQQRADGTDRMRSQSVPQKNVGDLPVDVLLPLNQSYDTAALDRSRLFKSHDDWLMQTTEWILGNTEATVAVRQHPCERIDRGNENYQTRLQSQFGGNPRLRFIAASDPVNTYDLIRSAKLVLPHVSTVGIEAVGLGKPVVIEADAYYAGLGFVRQAKSREEYFAEVKRGLRGELPVTPEEQRLAWSCYYLTQLCNYLPTDFTPIPKDFEAWSASSFAALASREDLGVVVEALETATPLAVLSHRRRAREQPVAT
jgi:Capsule polysaccharide biosynthesis protein